MASAEHFCTHGFAVFDVVLHLQQVELARQAVARLVERYRTGESTVVEAGVSTAEVMLQRSDALPSASGESLSREPYIIGDLLAFEPDFVRILAEESVWRCAATCLGADLHEVVFHFSNLTRKMAMHGPRVNWHRDGSNTYFASEDGRTVRLIFPLETMGPSNGGTQVQPGSHCEGTEGSAALCPVVYPGACLALHAMVLHGGEPNRSDMDRNVLVMQFGLAHSKLRKSAAEAGSLQGLEAFANRSWR